MDVIVYYLVCFLARKKLFLNVSYFLGTLVFISLSYNTANKLYKVPNRIQVSVLKPEINDTQISNELFQYEDRMKFLRNKCDDKRNLSISIHHDKMLNHLGFVLRSHSLFYCSVPKVATRTLLTYLTYLHIRNELMTSFPNNLTSYFNTDYLNQMISSSIKNDSLLLLSRFMTIIKSNSSQLDLWSMYQHTALPYIRLRTLSDPSIIFSNAFTRIIFVRHPFERLASAYVDKITSLKAEPFTMYDSLRREICRKFSSSYLTKAEQRLYHNKLLKKQINEPCEKIVPTFEHFIEYIMAESAQIDVHWQPYSTLCNVCTLKYNFIGKYETIQEDMNLLRSKLGINLTDWNINNHFSTGKTKEYYKLMYSKLSKDLVCNLKDFYSEDLKLFDYRLEDYFTDLQQINCPSQYYRRFRKLI